MPHSHRSSFAEKARIHRQRRREAGIEDVLFQLPAYAVKVIDMLKERRGLRSRSQALLQLIDEKGAVAQ
jgi:hypothetical protein